MGSPNSALKLLSLWVCAVVAQHLQAQAQAGTGTAASAIPSTQAWPSRIWPQRWVSASAQCSVDIPVHSGVVSAACHKDMPCIFLSLAASCLFIHLFPLHFWNRVCFSCVPITKKVNYSDSCRAHYYWKRRSLLTSEHTWRITQPPYHSFFPSGHSLGNLRHLKTFKFWPDLWMSARPEKSLLSPTYCQ